MAGAWLHSVAAVVYSAEVAESICGRTCSQASSNRIGDRYHAVQWYAVPLAPSLVQDEHQQQQQEEEESEEGEAAAAAAEAVQASGEDTEADNPLSVLRVGKCAVVVLGNELAAVSARRNPPLFG